MKRFEDKSLSTEVYDKMSKKELKRNIKRYNKLASITRVIAVIVYILCAGLLIVYLETYFKLTQTHLFMALVLVMITACIISGFEAVMDGFYRSVDLMNLALENKKEGGIEVDESDDI